MYIYIYIYMYIYIYNYENKEILWAIGCILYLVLDKLTLMEGRWRKHITEKGAGQRSGQISQNPLGGVVT